MDSWSDIPDRKDDYTLDGKLASFKSLVNPLLYNKSGLYLLMRVYDDKNPKDFKAPSAPSKFADANDCKRWSLYALNVYDCRESWIYEGETDAQVGPANIALCMDDEEDHSCQILFRQTEQGYDRSVLRLRLKGPNFEKSIDLRRLPVDDLHVSQAVSQEHQRRLNEFERSKRMKKLLAALASAMATDD